MAKAERGLRDIVLLRKVFTVFGGEKYLSGATVVTGVVIITWR
jgi:hypothetical protein